MTKLLKPVTIEKNQIVSDLRRIGLKEGSHVAVTISLKNVGFLKGGPDAFIDALLEVVGPQGTLMMNTHTPLFPLSEIDPKYVFDPQTSLPWTGTVPCALLKRKDAIRSRHPACSVVAVGKLAKYLTDGHDENAQNENLPYEKLAEIHGYYLCVGLNDNFVAIRHEAQRRAGLFVVPKFTGVLYKNMKGEIKPYVLRNASCTISQPKLVPQLVEEGVVKRGHIGMAPSTIAPANELIKAMASILKKDPTLNLCDKAFCLECRELERRLNLYNRLRNPKFFQKNHAARKLISLRNKIVLKRYTRLSLKHSRQNRIPSFGLLADSYIPAFIYSISGILRKRRANSAKKADHSPTSL